jgi:hypothetical protein
MTDSFDLQRFVDEQAPVYSRVLDELRRGRKQSHWMWFVFPQVAGLGHSAMAQRFAITSREEAIAYLAHSVLGSRLRERGSHFAASFQKKKEGSQSETISSAKRWNAGVFRRRDCVDEQHRHCHWPNPARHRCHERGLLPNAFRRAFVPVLVRDDRAIRGMKAR